MCDVGQQQGLCPDTNQEALLALQVDLFMNIDDRVFANLSSSRAPPTIFGSLSVETAFVCCLGSLQMHHS